MKNNKNRKIRRHKQKESINNETSCQEISLCMMVKDEETFLPGCLESVRGVVDEIIIVDTGSIDRTVEIAESFGAKVYHHPWENDFSKHRNQSLSYATKDWILIMDADEELDKETSHIIRKIVKESPTAVVSFNVRSYLENGSYYSDGFSPRLFRNRMGFYYDGYVHNQLKLKDKVTPSSVILWHYGYDLTPDKMKEKQLRSLGLLRKQMEEFPDNPSTRHHLAMTLLGMGEYEEAAKEAKITIENRLPEHMGYPYFAWTYFIGVSALMKLERLNEADTFGQKAIKEYNWDLDVYHCLAQIKFVKKEYDEGLKYGIKYLELRQDLLHDISKFPTFQFETAQRDWVIHRAMGYSHLYKNNIEKAFNCFKMAFDRVPEQDELILLDEIGHNLTKINELDKAIFFLKKIPTHESNFFRGFMELGSNYEKKEKYDDAFNLYREIENTFAEKAEIPFKMGMIMLKQEKNIEAIKAFEKTIKIDSRHVNARINMGLALENLGEIEQAVEKYREALSLDPDSAFGNLNIGLLYFRQGDYPDALPFLEKCVKDASENIYLCLVFSKIYLIKGDIDAMLPHSENILKLLGLPSDIMLESMDQFADLYFDIADKLFTQNRVEASDIALDIALRLSPDTCVEKIKKNTEKAFKENNYKWGLKLLDIAVLAYPKDETLLGLIQKYTTDLSE